MFEYRIVLFRSNRTVVNFNIFLLTTIKFKKKQVKNFTTKFYLTNNIKNVI